MVLKLPREQKEELIRKVQQYFYEERSEEIGELAAEFLLDYMIKEIGPYLYNQAVTDATKVAMDRMASLEDDLHALHKSTRTNR